MQNEIKKIFSKLLVLIFLKLNPIHPRKYKKVNSLAHMNLVMAFEKEFKIKFTDEEINEMLNYELIEEIITNKK